MNKTYSYTLLPTFPKLPSPLPVPDTEDEEESSFVEGKKLTDKEQDEIGEEVDKALEENFEQCEKIVEERKSKEKVNGDVKAETSGDAKTETNGDVKAETNGDAKTETNGDAKVETNGDAKTETNGDVKTETNGDVKAETNGEAMETDADEKSDYLPSPFPPLSTFDHSREHGHKITLDYSVAYLARKSKSSVNLSFSYWIFHFFADFLQFSWYHN